MLAVVSWDGGGDQESWTDPANWDSDTLPTAVDEVVIGSLGSTASVRIESVTVSVKNIQSSTLLDLTEADLTLTSGGSQFDGITLTNSDMRFTDGEIVVEGDLYIGSGSSMAVESQSTNFTSRSRLAHGIGWMVVSGGATATFLEDNIEFNIEADRATARLPNAQSVASLLAKQAIIDAPFVSELVDSPFGTTIHADSGGVILLGTNVQETNINGAIIVGRDSSFVTRQANVDSDGSLSGSGVLVGDVRMSRGQMNPEGLTITGDLHATNTFHYILSADTAQLQVLGDVAVAGRLRIEVAEGFVPAAGSSFSIVSNNTVQGQFDTIQVEANSSGVTFDVTQSPNSIDLRAVADPGPRVTRVEVSDRMDALEYIDVFFDQAVQPYDDDFTLFASGESVNLVERTLGMGNSIRLWTKISGAGEYELTIGPNIRNLNGNPIDLDGDGIPGESMDDAVSTTVVVSDVRGPHVKNVDVSSLSQGPITDFLVTFTEPMNVTSFSSEDIVFRSDDGQILSVPLTIEPSSYACDEYCRGISQDGVNDTYRVFLEGDLPDGVTTVEIGPFVEDVSGHPMNEDGNDVFGEETDLFRMEWGRPSPLPLGSLNGRGAFVEVFLSPNDYHELKPSILDRLTPEISGIRGEIYFMAPGPRGGPTVPNKDDPLSAFLGPAIPLDEAAASLDAGSFRLRSSFYLAIREEMDLDATTPEIDIRLGVYSDDGFSLSVGGEFIDDAADRAFSDSWSDLSFATPGLYPVELLYYANHIGQSGLQLRRQTAIDGEEIVPAGDIYLDTSRILPGDVNGNGSVDSTDLGLLLNSFGKQSPELGWVDGDLDGNKVIDSDDLTEVLNSFGVSRNTLAFLDGEEEEEEEEED